MSLDGDAGAEANENKRNGSAKIAGFMFFSPI
jgi:hypothetical protein